jgi:hypothetical protein
MSSHLSKCEHVSLGLLVAAVATYAFWLTHGTFQLINWPSSGSDSNLIFNSMLEHMSHGRYDIDPAVVGNEGFVHGGRVYAYWGILPALLRTPLLFFPGGLRLDVTCLSSLAAVSLAATMKFNTLGVVFRNAAPSNSATLYWALLLVLLFGGAQIQFLKPSVYQEACLWAGAFSACFVFLAVRGLLVGAYSIGSLCCMAAVSGLALLTRASTGVGLYLSMSALLVVQHIQTASSATISNWKCALRSTLKLGSSRGFLSATAVLFFGAAITGYVNYERWGSPLVFADYHTYVLSYRFPDRLARLQEYGLFTPVRMPFATMYYFFPLWILHQPDGQLLFQATQTRLFDSAELPPASFLLTDALLLILFGFASWVLFVQNRFVFNRAIAIAIATGLFVDCALILSYATLSFRYRIDFYPLFEFGAFVGAALVLRTSLLAEAVVRRGIVAASAMSIVASHIALLLYKISSFGSSVRALEPGIFHYYMEQLGPHIGRFHWFLG